MAGAQRRRQRRRRIDVEVGPGSARLRAGCSAGAGRDPHGLLPAGDALSPRAHQRAIRGGPTPLLREVRSGDPRARDFGSWTGGRLCAATGARRTGRGMELWMTFLRHLVGAAVLCAILAVLGMRSGSNVLTSWCPMGSWSSVPFPQIVGC